MWEELIALLQSQSLLYGELLESARQKKALVINNDVEALRLVTARENSLIGKLRRAEREREGLVSAMAGKLGVPAEGVTLAGLARRAPGEAARKQLAELHSRLKSCMGELKDLNEQSKALISQSLEYIDFSMNLIRSSVAGPVYAGAEEARGQAFFDARG